jgi:hypothetical protein
MQSQPLVVGSGRIFFLETDLAPLWSNQQTAQEFCVCLLTIRGYGGMRFVFVAGDFANNAVGWQRSAMKVGLRFLAKRGATLHLLINPDPLLGFHVLKVWKPEFVLPRAVMFVSLA